MYAGRSRSKSPMMSKRRRGSKSPMRGKYVTGRGSYGFEDFVKELAGPAVLAGGAIGGPVGAAMAGLVGLGVSEAEKGIGIAVDAFEQMAKSPGRWDRPTLYSDLSAAERARILTANANMQQRMRGKSAPQNATNLPPLPSNNTARPYIAPGIAVSGVTGKGLYSATPQLRLGGVGQSNSLIKGGRSPLQFGGSRDETGSLIVSFSEFVRDISAPTSGQFGVTAYGLNPGIAESFPLLSQFAQNFEEYEFQQLIIEFRSAIDASSTTNASGNVGSIIMATNYNADADLFQDKEQMLLYSGGVEARITENCYHGLECEASKLSGSAMKFVRASNLPIGDYKDYDKGLFQIAFNNVPTAFQGVQVGALYAHYTVKLSKPKLWSGIGNNILTCRYYTTTGLAFNNIVGTNLCTALKSTIKGVTLTNTNVLGSFGVRFTFPDNLSGIFDIYSSLECSGTGLSYGTSTVQVNPVTSPTSQPRIALYADMGTGVPYGTTGAAASWYVASGTGYIIRIRVKMTPTMVAGSNWVEWANVNGGSTLIASYHEVTEQGNALATSSSLPFPTWINSSGQVVAAP